MNKDKALYPQLAAERQTKTRHGVLAVLRGRQPLAAPEILVRLKKQKVVVNKTTVYRELEFLLKKKVISEMVLQDGLKRYELTPAEHGHHLVCLDCRAIEHVVLDKDLEEQEKQISRSRHFKIMSHSLEFYGLCRRCTKK